MFLLSGLFQIALGVLGVGKYIKYIPYPVVSGFMTAIGVIILITQILPVLGYDVKNDAEYIEQFKPLSGPLFFGFTSEFVNISKQIPKTASILIIRMDKVPFIDQSGLFALEDVLLELYQKENEILRSTKKKTESPSQCSECNKTFVNNYLLDHHMRIIHKKTQEEIYHSYQSEKKFPLENVVSVQKGKKLVPLCHVCGRHSKQTLV